VASLKYPAVLVTGATGRIGANLARQMCAQGYAVRALVRPGSPRAEKLAALDVETAPGSLTDADSLVAAARGVDAVIHLGAALGGDASTSESFAINVAGTRLLLEAASARGSGCRKLVYASTDATYPAINPRYVPIDERHPQAPCSLYGVTKLCGEIVTRDFSMSKGFPTTIVRIGTAFPGTEFLRLWTAPYVRSVLAWSRSHPHPVPPELTELDAESFVVPRTPEGRVWCHHPTDVRDTVAGLLCALEADTPPGEAYNMVGPRAVGWDEVAPYLAETLGRPCKSVVVSYLWQLVIENSKAIRDLGYRPSVDIRASADDAIRAARGEPTAVISR